MGITVKKVLDCTVDKTTIVAKNIYTKKHFDMLVECVFFKLK